MSFLLAALLAAFTVVQNGDQHIVFKDAEDRPVRYYHTVTDSWCEADRLVPKRHFSFSAWAVVVAYFGVVVLMGWCFALVACIVTGLAVSIFVPRKETK